MFRKVKSALETLSSVLVMVAAGALLWQVYRLPLPPPPPPPPPPPVQDVTLSLPASSVRHVRGTGNVVLVEFADFECPFCGRHANSVAPEIERELVEPNQLQRVFLNFPLPRHPRAQKAGEAAECAAQQDRFWDMHSRLFQEPRALDIPDLLAHAAAIGFDEAAFGECLEKGRTAQRVRADVDEGRRLGVNSTPVFFVGVREPNGNITLVKRINGAVPLEVFRQAIADVSAARGNSEREAPGV